MNDTPALAPAVSGTTLLFIVFISVFIYICTCYSGIYGSFKKPVKTVGVIAAVYSG